MATPFPPQMPPNGSMMPPMGGLGAMGAQMPQGPGMPPQGGMPPEMMGGMPPGMEGMPPEAQMGMPPEQAQEPETDMEAILDAALASSNLAKDLDQETLDKISDQCMKGYETDLQSCEDWLKNNRKWLSLALLLSKEKTYPWRGASNVKYPLIATAAMQFTARSYPTLVPSDGNIVKTRIVGYDLDGSRTERADRIAKHMSYQIMYRMPMWEEEMDKLLLMEAIMGVCFKKTYFDSALNRVVSKLVLPENLIVNYFAKSLETAYRKTEIMSLSRNEYESRVRSGEFLELDDELGEASTNEISEIPESDKPKANNNQMSGESDEATPHVFLAQHTFYDIDGDGYEEPVVVVLHKETRQVVRILPRFESSGVK